MGNYEKMMQIFDKFKECSETGSLIKLRFETDDCCKYRVFDVGTRLKLDEDNLSILFTKTFEIEFGEGKWVNIQKSGSGTYSMGIGSEIKFCEIVTPSEVQEELYDYGILETDFLEAVEMCPEKLGPDWFETEGYEATEFNNELCYCKDGHHFKLNPNDGTYIYVDRRNIVYGLKKSVEVTKLFSIIGN